MNVDYVKCGDCLELIKELPDKSVDVSFTSPPYNRVRNDTYAYYDDNRIDYLELLTNITNEMLRVTKHYVIVNIQCNHFNKSEFYQWLGKFHNLINGVIIWEKTNPQPGNNINRTENTRSITNAFEYFIVLKDGNKFVSYGEEPFKNIIKSTVNTQHFKGHGAVMKKEVCDILLSKFTKTGDIVLDPFNGTGTTSVSCIEQDRHYIGFEITPEYYDISQERINKALQTKQYAQMDISSLLDLVFGGNCK